MAKVVFEFDECEDRDDVNIIVNRSKLLTALYDLQSLRRNIYKGYMNGLVTIKDNQVVFKDGKALTEYNTEGAEEYINTDYLISRLDEILNDVNYLIY